MRTYKELELIPASDYLNPDNFIDARWDTVVGSAQQYKEGLDVSNNAETIVIGSNSVWSARMVDGASLTSCEGIGYHANTAALLRGFLDGPAAIVVYRMSSATNGKLTKTFIKQSTRK